GGSPSVVRVYRVETFVYAETTSPIAIPTSRFPFVASGMQIFSREMSRCSGGKSHASNRTIASRFRTEVAESAATVAMADHGAPRHGRGRVLRCLSARRAAAAVRGARGQPSPNRLHRGHSKALPSSTHPLVRSARHHPRTGRESADASGRHRSTQHQHPLACPPPSTGGGGRPLRPAPPAYRPSQPASVDQD